MSEKHRVAVQDQVVNQLDCASLGKSGAVGNFGCLLPYLFEELHSWMQRTTTSCGDAFLL